MNRSDLITQIRPAIYTENNNALSIEERFQNKVLRPILKLQHDLLCMSFLKTKEVGKLKFETKDHTQKKDIITKNLKTNQKLKTHILHLITSLMTVSEYGLYLQSPSQYNKRIISMATQRLIDGLVDE